ncbi:MAG: UvrD-helicase domain-containing protein [Candidatus Babeliales bacterium]
MEKLLNESQQAAVLHENGPLLVTAGAGSGKTGVITYRIADLLVRKNIAPKAIIGLTFTNKAAGEMKERIERAAPDKQQPFIGTFHSYCLNILKNNIGLLNRPAFTILDADDQHSMLQTIIKRSRIDKKTNPKTLAYQISMYKNSAVTQTNQELFVDPLFRELLLEYEREKRVSNCFDFDDLLIETVQLFLKHEEFRQRHQQTVRHILVDEYQDTNSTQHALLKAMALDKKKFVIDSLCAVGDEDQSIYSWRGATIHNMLNFAHDFAGTQTIKIEQNYRCAQPILDVANSIINYNIQRNPKNLWSTKKGADRVRVLHCFSGYQEGIVITELVNAIRSHPHHGSYSVAVLYRAHYQSRAIEEALIRQSITYTIVGGIEFYERKEIKDIFAYLKLLANPFDRVAFFRIINCPLRGLGDKLQEQLYQLWQEQPFYSFEQCIQLALNQGLVSGIKKDALVQFVALYTEAKKNIHNAAAAIQFFIAQTQYIAYLQQAYEKDESETKIENIKELLRAAEHFTTNGITSVEQLLHEVALMQHKMNDTDEQHTPVTLMTIHAAKGLEFDLVVIAGMEEGIFPSARSIVDPELVEEERRLLYVAITRAKEYLLITHAKNRHSFGSMTDQRPSRFIQEIPSKTASSSSALHWNERQINTYCAEWLGTQKKNVVYTFNSTTVQNTPVRKPIAAQPREQYPQSRTSELLVPFAIRESVTHATFGIGVVQAIETKDSTTSIVTVQFPTGTKKISAHFLKKLQ